VPFSPIPDLTRGRAARISLAPCNHPDTLRFSLDPILWYNVYS
jgi:hypothetical protein